MCIAVSAAVFLMASCSTFEVDEEGVVGQIYDIQGVKVLADPGGEAMVAAVLRNDNPHGVEVTFRTLGGRIGWIYGKGGSSNFSQSSGEQLAGWLVSDPIDYLEPGEEILVTAFLNNWYDANKSFESRIEIIIRYPGPSTRMKIRFDEHTVFSDPGRIFQENKMGRNDPRRYGARANRFGDLPKDYELTIPG